MFWIKKGLIFKPDPNHNYDWMISHAQVPIAELVDEKSIRIYFGTRNARNQTVTAFIEVDASRPQKNIKIHNKPVLGLGKLGSFDDSGAMPSWIVNKGNEKYLYYIGWNVGGTVPYRNSIGLAISIDGGLTFKKPFEGPIIDRTITEPYMTATPCVKIENGIWRMWYLSCVGWRTHNNYPEPYYNIKYAESKDGIHWAHNAQVCIDFKSPKEGGIARPSVIKDGATYKMWFSYRGGEGYRTEHSETYRIGYAESKNGISWTRKDEEAGIDVSESGWDSEMTCYPYVVEINGKLNMFYNGNGFGKSGIGYAVLEA